MAWRDPIQIIYRPLRAQSGETTRFLKQVQLSNESRQSLARSGIGTREGGESPLPQTHFPNKNDLLNGQLPLTAVSPLWEHKFENAVAIIRLGFFLVDGMR